MSAWGDKDDVASPGTVGLASLAVTGSGTSFTNYTVGNIITIADAGGSAVIGAITSDTALTLAANTELTVGTLSGKNYTVSEKPVIVVANQTDTDQVFGVDTTEQTVDQTKVANDTVNNRNIANTAAHAGWVKIGDIYTDSNSQVRRKSETLVAMSTISADAADDTTLADS